MDELQNIQNLIYVIRGQRVMLDFNLAKIYQVETKYLPFACQLSLFLIYLQVLPEKIDN